MKTIIFSFPGNEDLTEKLCKEINAESGQAEIRRFPDGENYTRVLTDVQGKNVVLVCTLNNPDEKLLPLYFFAKTCKENGAGKIVLVAPYLAYMRQDKQFNKGEGVTSKYFASLLSSFCDVLITVDPHLHRFNSLSDIYTIPAYSLHSADLIADYIHKNIENPVLIGPDSESKQWVSKVAESANAPYLVLEKIRHGDKDVEVSVPQVEKYKTHTPVLVDDIISTGHTMMETVKHLLKAGMKAPVCIGVHAVFTGNAYEELLAAGASAIITTNTIFHKSNKIEISVLIADALLKLEKEKH